jgi:hypothetical protein
MRDMRGYRFCEVGLITGASPDNAIANIAHLASRLDLPAAGASVLDSAARWCQTMPMGHYARFRALAGGCALTCQRGARQPSVCLLPIDAN